MCKRILILGLVVLGVTAAVFLRLKPEPARADAYIYSAQKREIKVCNLLLESFRPRRNDPAAAGYKGIENADPHVFYILDSRTDIKPRNWELVNPLAPRVVTQEIRDRWLFLDPQHPYQVGQPVTKDMACYWEVYLDTNNLSSTLEKLLQFDLIFLTSHIGKEGPGPTPGNVEFTLADREALRKLVDMGGTLWLDDCWLMRIEPQPGLGFFLDVNFQGQSLAGYNGRPRYSAVVVDPYHPLLNSPFRLTEEEINHLGDKNVDDYRITGLLGGSTLPDPVLFPVVNNGGDFGAGPGRHPYIAAGRYGNGRILVTAGDIACDINDRIQDPPAYRQIVLNPNRPDLNGGAYCGPDVWRAPTEDLKFVYNILNWAQGESDYRRGPRRTGYTRDEVKAPLEVAWRVPLLPGTRLSTAPVVSRNIVYVGTDDGWIYALDAQPYEDRDGDGNPNDGVQQGIVGLQDLTPASPYDVIWAFDLGRGRRVSAMTIGTTVVNTVPKEALYFITADGELVALDALPVDPSSGRLLHTASVLWNAVNLGSGLSAPVVSRGIVYLLTRNQTVGTYRLCMFRADNGQSPFAWWAGTPPAYVDLAPLEAADTANNILPPVTATLIRDDRNGGNAEVAYVTLPSGSLVAVATSVSGEMAEYVRTVDTDNDGVPDQTRYRLRHAWVQDRDNDGNADPLVVLQYNGAQFVQSLPGVPVPNAPREFQVAAVIPQSHRMVVERYEVDFRDATLGSRKPYLEAPGYLLASKTPRTAVFSGAAVAPDDTLYYATGNGFVQAVRERGGGGTAPSDSNLVLWRYNLNDYQPDLDPTNMRPDMRPGTYLPVDTDPGYTRRWVPARFADVDGDNVGEWTPLPPAVSDDLLYVAMNRYQITSDPNQPQPQAQPGPLLEGRVFAFERRPTFYIDLDEPIVGLGYEANYPGGVIPPIDPFRVTGEMTLYQYCPEGIGATQAQLQGTGITIEDPNGPNNPPDPQIGEPGWYSIPFRSGFFTYDRASNRIVVKSFGPVLSASLPAVNPATGQVVPGSCQLPIWVDPDGPAPQSGPRPNEEMARPFRLSVQAWPRKANVLEPSNLTAGTWATSPTLWPIERDNLLWHFPDPASALVPGTVPPVTWPGGCPAGLSSPPSVSGGVLYVGTGDGRLLALDADPRDGTDGTRADVGGSPVFILEDEGWNDVTEGFRDPNRPMPTSWTPLDSPTVPPDVLWSWAGGRQWATPPDPTGARRMETPGGACITSNLVSTSMHEVDPISGLVRGVLYGFVEPVYTVGDASRLIQANREGQALWMLHETILRTNKYYSTIPATDAPYGTPPSDIITTHLLLSRPQSATRLSADLTLLADTGNNRVIAVDQTGTVQWQATEIYDPYEVLPDGEYQIGTGYNNEQNVRLSYLNSPTDVVQWVTPDIAANGQLDFGVRVRHTLIADAGNYRVVEIVDKFRPGQVGYLSRTNPTDPNPPASDPRWYHVVVWASQTNVGHRDPYGPNGQGRWRPGMHYQYTSVQPIQYVTRYYNGVAYPTYTERALVTISNYALYRVGNTRQQRVGGASLAILEGVAKPIQPYGIVQKAYLLDDPRPNAEPGYVSRIGIIGNTDPNRLEATSRPMLRPVSIRRFRFKWGGQEEWHDLYVDATGIYQWRVSDRTKLPDLVITPNAQCINADPSGGQYRMYSQFWRENYQQMMKDLEVALENALGQPGAIRPNPQNTNADFQPGSFLFEPGAVSLMPGGGWVVVNRHFDRALSSVLQQADKLANVPPDQAGRRDRNIQVFQLRSNPTTELGTPGDYDPSKPNFGYKQTSYTQGSITFLFGPQIRDRRTGRDLGADLSNPMFAIRTE